MLSRSARPFWFYSAEVDGPRSEQRICRELALRVYSPGLFVAKEIFMLGTHRILQGSNCPTQPVLDVTLAVL